MRYLRPTLVATFALLFAAQLLASGLPDDVEAVLSTHCFKCHGEKKRSGKLDLRTLESIRAGGKRGPAIAASDVEASRILQLVQPGAKPHMPPGKKKQLSSEEITTLTKWIHGLSTVHSTEDTRSDSSFIEADSSEDIASDSDSPSDNSVSISKDTEPNVAIDKFVSANYERLGIAPADQCNDATFVRRIYLDLLGRIPTIVESRQFLTNTNDDDRHRHELIERLLENDEFPQHWAKLFDAMLMGRKEKKLSDRKRHGWHKYLEAVFKDRKPWDEVAREILLARGGTNGEPKQRGHLWFLYERDNKHQDMAEAIARGFFGVDIACAQCHDHPMADEIEQAHYWGLVGFFKRTTNTKSDNGIALAESAIGGFDSYANALTGSTDESVLTFLDRQPVAETRPEKPEKQKDKDEFYTNVEREPRVPKFSRRQKFVDEILEDHPLLARAMVNRVWAILMGRGLVHPIDKMDSQHPASHPELLDWLAADFANNDFDVLRLVEAIVKSRTYQLDSRRPIDATGNPIEPSTFAYGLQKPLPAETAVGALQTALQLSDEETDEELGKQFRKLFPDIVIENQLTTLKQTMMLSNHLKLRDTYLFAAKKLVRDGEQEAKQRSADKHLLTTNDFIQRLYERVFVRTAEEDELNAVQRYLQARESRLQEALADVLWAMTTSAEFRFNH